MKIKKAIILFPALILLFFALALTVTAESSSEILTDTKTEATSGTTGNCTWNLDGTKLTISGNGEMESYSKSAPWGTSITEAVIENGVTSIGRNAFYGCTNLSCVRIGNTVTRIGEYAFRDCKSLLEIVFPSSVTYIQDAAFRESTLKRAGFQRSKRDVYENVRILGLQSLGGGFMCDLYFNVCYDVEHIYSSGCDIRCDTCFWEREAWNTHIFEENALLCKNCSAAQYLKFEINDNEEFAITDCDSSVKGKLVIPQIIDNFTVTVIESSAFSYCRNLTSIVLPETITTIKDDAFYGCKRLSQMVIPDSVTSIGDSVFRDCTGLYRVTIGNSVKSIAQWAFLDCSNLESITFGSSVEYIGKEAFRGCNNLEEVTLPASVTTIEQYAFYDCWLKSLTIGDFNSDLNDGQNTTIGKYAFSKCNWLDTVTLGKNITRIEVGAFEDCGSFDLIMSKNVTFIGYEAFHYSTINHIWYEGSEVDRNRISRENGNDALISATWHFNTCAPDSHVYINDHDTTCEKCEWTRKPLYIPGDLDGVEGVSSSDAIYLLYYTLLGEKRYPVNQSVDYNKDGAITSADAIYLLYYTLLGEERYPI